MAAQPIARLSKRCPLLLLGLACALSTPAGAIPQDDTPARPESDSRPPAAAREPAARPPAEPAPQPRNIRVLTEREKRCRQARGCTMEEPCLPCAR
jgi:hypothetical protein